MPEYLRGHVDCLLNLGAAMRTAAADIRAGEASAVPLELREARAAACDDLAGVCLMTAVRLLEPDGDGLFEEALREAVLTVKGCTTEG